MLVRMRRKTESRGTGHFDEIEDGDDESEDGEMGDSRRLARL